MSFTYRGTTSDSMFFNVTERQVYNAPAFDVNAIEVPGRSGDVLNSQERFKNKTLVYTGFVRSSDFPGSTQWERLSRGLRNIKAWICGDAGKYHDLTDDYDPGFVRRAFVSGETAINILFDRPDGATITITFLAEPFMYEVSEPIELPETKSASGSIITITDGAENTPLKSAVVNIEPVQDLHGYDFPWPGGGGKNILPNSLGTKTFNGVTCTSASDGKITITGIGDGDINPFFYLAGSSSQYPLLLKAGTYVLSQGITLPRDCFLRIQKSGATVASVPNGQTSVSFTLSEDAYVNCYLRIDKNANFSTAKVVEPMLCLSTAIEPTTFAPYSNICPISGWAQVNVWVKPTYDTSLTPTATIPLGRTVYGGTLNLVRGKLNAKPYYASYSGQTLVGPWISSHDKYVAGGTPTTGAQVVDMGAAGTDYDVTPQTIKTLLGTNNIWANTGETEVGYIVPTENPTEWPSKPRLEITMSGAGTLTVNGKTWSIGAYTGTLICDSEIMDWYDAGALKNSLVSGDGFPELVPGDNVITYTGGITKVVATQRWRTL